MEVSKIPYEEYKHLAEGFYPSRFNADEWVKAFKAAGARYVTFTSRHHDGFSMFKTAQSTYNVVDGSPLFSGRHDYYPLCDSRLSSGRTVK